MQLLQGSFCLYTNCYAIRKCDQKQENRMKKIVIAGGTGFIGSYLSKRFKEKGYRVVIVSRTKGKVSWKPMELEEALNGAEVVINLAGKSINCRHNDFNRKLLIKSRVEPTLWIGNAIQACEEPPKLWINASASGIYKESESKSMTESETDLGKNFLAKMVKKWEKAFFGFHLPKTGQIALRTSVVLGNNGGALEPLVTLSKLWLGGKQGDGKQMFSWIHIEDYFRVIEFLMNTPEPYKIYNCTSPAPVTNGLLMKKIRSCLHIPFGLPAPVWIVKLGAFFIGTEPELILDSSNLYPENLVQSGFEFTYPTIDQALNDLLK